MSGFSRDAFASSTPHEPAMTDVATPERAVEADVRNRA